MKCAIYARVSTDRQRERHTIDSQLRLLPEHAQRQGWEIVHVYKDDGKSGETVDARPAFKKLLDDAAEKLFDAVLVIDLDRITRSRKSAEGAVIYDHFREHGIKLATPTQGLIDLDDEDQDLLVGIKRELAKWEKRKIVGRMMRGKREAAKKGKRFSCLDPYGYPTVLYEQVRCKLVHEGELDGKASRFPMTTRDEARISYVNRTVAIMGGGQIPEPQRDRRIFFHMTWLTDLVQTLARNADAELAKGPIPKPATWWLSP